MARDVSIAISAQDNYTATITKIRNSMTPFRKDLSALGTELNKLNATKVNLQTNMTAVKKELDDAKRAFKDTASEANRTRLSEAQEQYNNLADSLKAVSRQANATQKDIDRLTTTVSKSENRSGLGNGSGGQETGLLSGLGKSGIYQMLGQTVSNSAGVLVSSAFGDITGSYFNNILGGISSGAAIGSMVGGPVGTVIGAVGGAVAGVANAATEQFKKEDDAFRSTVEGLYQDQKDAQQTSLTSGSAIAANRENALISFTTLFGDEGAARGFLNEIKDFANITPFLYDDLTAMSKVLKTYGYEIDELMPTMQAIGDTGAALGIDQSGMSMIATALGRMRTSNKTTTEYLNLLIERGVPAYDYLAKAAGKTKEQVIEMVEKGLIPGEEAAKAIVDYMGTEFSGSMEGMSQTYSGLSSTLQGLQEEMDNAMGEGYNEERSKGLQAQIEWLSGASGEAVQEAYRAMGAWQASLENDREAYIRVNMNQAIQSDEYQKALAENDGAAMGRLIAEAQAQAENEYKASDGYQLQLATDLELIRNIQENTELKEEYWNTGVIMGEQFSKGLASVMANSLSISYWQSYDEQNKRINEIQGGKGHAYGLSRVPYNNYHAILHEGERVLTASEARALQTGGDIYISGNQFIIREDADVEKIAQRLIQKINLARMAAV